jgi:hypothetical protein
VWRVFNRQFGSFNSPDVPHGAMVRFDKAATWEDEAEADAEAERLNERDRVPEYGELGHNDWIALYAGE